MSDTSPLIERLRHVGTRHARRRRSYTMVVLLLSGVGCVALAWYLRSNFVSYLLLHTAQVLTTVIIWLIPISKLNINIRLPRVTLLRRRGYRGRGKQETGDVHTGETGAEAQAQ